MFEVLQRWGHQGAEVRYLLHHQRAPGRGDSGRSRFQSSFQSALMCCVFFGLWAEPEALAEPRTQKHSSRPQGLGN